MLNGYLANTDHTGASWGGRYEFALGPDHMSYTHAAGHLLLAVMA